MDDLWIWMLLIICAINTIVCELLRRSIKHVDRRIDDIANFVPKFGGYTIIDKDVAKPVDKL